MMHGDVPLNLTATSLVTHAYALTGDDKYRTWVLDYLESWTDRIRRNDGICPDNVGPSGAVGECMDGKWWGGYYGWSWPHGFPTIIEPLTVAAMNAVLLTGDMGYLDIPRGQLDFVQSQGREGQRPVAGAPPPHRFGLAVVSAVPTPAPAPALLHVLCRGGSGPPRARAGDEQRMEPAGAGPRQGRRSACRPLVPLPARPALGLTRR